MAWQQHQRSLTDRRGQAGRLRLGPDVEGAIRPLHKHLRVALHEVLDGAEARRIELAPRVVQHRLQAALGSGHQQW